MVDLHQEIEINENEAEAIAQGLFAIARADGDIHPGEAALIAEFYASTTETASDLGALERSPTIPGDLLALRLPTTDLRAVFLKTAMLLAYADGEFGEGEAKLIGEYAAAMSIGEETLAELKAQVKDFLLAQLSHLQNVQAGAEVAHELDV